MCIRDRWQTIGMYIGMMVGFLYPQIGLGLGMLLGIALGRLVLTKIPVNTPPVSYTHLDVYKRQVNICLK